MVAGRVILDQRKARRIMSASPERMTRSCGMGPREPFGLVGDHEKVTAAHSPFQSFKLSNHK
jgi:hypothetical protein